MLKFQIDGMKAYNITSNEKQEVHFITLAFIPGDPRKCDELVFCINSKVVTI